MNEFAIRMARAQTELRGRHIDALCLSVGSDLPYLAGYTAMPLSLSDSRRNSSTRGEQPTVFSLKSRRSLPARPAVGGE